MEKNKVILGDSLKLMYGIPSKSVDMIIGDLDDKTDLHMVWRHFNRIIKTDGVIIMFGRGKITASMILTNYNNYRYNLVWDYVLPTGHLNANGMPMRIHMDMLVFYQKAPTYNPQKIKGEKNHNKGRMLKNTRNIYGEHEPVDNTEMNGDRKHPKTIISIPKDHSTKQVIPTQKPIELYEWLIKSYTNEGDIILDAFCGRGTTALASIRTNRNFYCIENNEETYQISMKPIKHEYDKSSNTFYLG